MNRYIKILFCVLLILIPSVFVFLSFFKSLHLAWGDAPFYYPEGLKELVLGLQVWSQTGINFGGKNLVLWLSPIMVIYGNLNKYFGLENDAITRILFYFPSVILAGLGPYFLTKYLKLSKNVQFFSSLFYILNTYFILLIDGGQVGIALAYGIFPFTILFWKKFFDYKTVNSFSLALIFTSILCAIDPRITIISFVLLFLWQILEGRIKNLHWLILAGMFLIPVNAFWLLPLIKGGAGGLSTSVTELQLSSLLNSLFLFAPHWPSNLFGKVIPPYFYFSLIPILMFGSFLFKKVDKRYYIFSFMFLFFAFIAKGSTPPLGNWYEFFVNKIPFGSIFRDSSKFFIPMILLGGILIGHTVEKSRFFSVLCYLYLVLLIFPAINGKLNFNLSSKKESSDYQIIYEHLKNETESFRTLWFNEKPQLGYETSNKIALNANQLVSFRPFSSINVGEDALNFLNNSNYIDWLRTFGVRYLILSGDPRNIFPSEKDNKNWSEITKLVSESQGLTKENWGTKIPVFEIDNPRPEAYTVNKMLLVVGPDLLSKVQIPITVYAEDGKFDPKILKNVSADSLKIVMNQGNVTDLTMSFLQNYFRSVQDSSNSEWSVFGADQYLKYKYELLIRGFKFNDFDYGRGIAFSTKEGEKIKFTFDILTSGKYIIAKRIATKDKQKLTWILESKTLNVGKFEYEVTNQSILSVLNTVAIISEDEFNKSTKLAESFVSTFGVTSNIGRLTTDWHEAEIKNSEGLRRTYKIDNNDHWLIFTQNYDTNWISSASNINLPVFSMINGFYLDQNDEIVVEYAGQKYLDLGIKISLGSILVLLVSYLWYEKVFRFCKKLNFFGDR